jgi:hypothetical protein
MPRGRGTTEKEDLEEDLVVNQPSLRLPAPKTLLIPSEAEDDATRGRYRVNTNRPIRFMEKNTSDDLNNLWFVTNLKASKSIATANISSNR